MDRNTRPDWLLEGGLIIDSGMVEFIDLQFMVPILTAFPSKSGPASPFSYHIGIP